MHCEVWIRYGPQENPQRTARLSPLQMVSQTWRFSQEHQAKQTHKCPSEHSKLVYMPYLKTGVQMKVVLYRTMSQMNLFILLTQRFWLTTAITAFMYMCRQNCVIFYRLSSYSIWNCHSFTLNRVFLIVHKQQEFNIWKKNRRVFVILNESYEIQEKSIQKKNKA